MNLLLFFSFLTFVAAKPLLLDAKTEKLLKIYKRKVAKKLNPLEISYQLDETKTPIIPDGNGIVSEVEINRNISELLIDGDILPSKELLRDLIRGLNRRQKRKMSSKPQDKWLTTHIGYTFTLPSYERKLKLPIDENDKWKIREGLRHVEAETCISFHEKSKLEQDEDGIYFYSGPGCFTNLGRSGGNHGVSIGLRCTGIIAHEVAHVLGLWHEQSRPDRDSYVRMNYAALLPGTSSNFEKRPATDVHYYNTAFDFGSLMMYGPKEFVQQWTDNSMESYDRNYQKTFGQRIAFSFSDAQIINAAYCKDRCDVDLPCENGGYTDPNNCYQCRCPSGFGGVYCNTAAYSKNYCGGDLDVGSSWSNLSFGPLEPDQECSWLLKAPETKRIVLEILEFDYSDSITCQSYLEIKYSSDFGTTGPRLCHSSLPQNTFHSQESIIALIHFTNQATSGFKGFKLRYKLDEAIPSLKQTREWSTWSDWGLWSICWPVSGCGTRERIRQCFSSFCPGDRKDSEVCGACG